jgi:deoxyadenosine/deoxycytidine kinase
MKMHIFFALIFTQWAWWLIEIFKTTLFFELMGQQLKLLIYLSTNSIPNLVGQIHKRGTRIRKLNLYWLFKSIEWRYEAWIHVVTVENYLLLTWDNINL